ncbi:MAG: serine/threonine-protein kinase [Planctomycetota bacterium]
MTPDQYEEMRKHYARLLELDPSAKTRELEKLSHQDIELANAVRTLLDREEIDSPLDHPLGTSDQLEEAMKIEGDPAPQRLGKYQIVGLLGCGGMGKVYEAYEEGRPERPVALKVLPPTLATDESIRRLQREAELLGTLDHPSIARVFEAGVLPASEHDPFPQAYFAMERVEGESLATATQHLGRADRLHLFRRICEGVQHAHERHVLHRDLKPSNIVVQADGTPRILDFGIGRRLDDSAVRSSFQTATGAILGTLPYMSPEQITAEADVDVRSDVYSLGVILYELLADQLPLELRGLTLPEAVDRVRAEEPRRLGTRNPELAGDLEVIAGKALAKEPEQRYSSVEELRSDVLRHLERAPILARRPSARYQLRRFYQRHRALALALVIIVAGLAVGMVGLSGGLIAAHDAIERLEEEQRVAKLEAERALATRSFLFQLLRSGLPDRTKGEDLSVRDLLVNSETRIEKLFGHEPELEAWAHETVGQCLFELGDPRDALYHCEQALELRRGLSETPTAEMLQTLDGLTRIHIELRNLDEAERLGREALEGRTALLGAKSPKTLLSRERLATLHYQRDEWQKAERMHRENQALFEEVHGPEHPQTVNVWNNLGNALASQGRHEEAMELFEKTLDARRREHGPDHPRTLTTASNLATTLLSGGRTEDAVTLLQDTVERCRRVYPAEHRQTSSTLHFLAMGLRRLERPREAKAIFDELLARELRQSGDDHPSVIRLRTSLSNVLLDLGDFDRAVAVCEEAIASADRRTPGGNWNTAVALSNYGRALSGVQRYDAAKGAFERAIRICRERNFGPRHFGRYVIQCNFARTLIDLGEIDRAAPIVEESLAFLEKEFGAHHTYTVKARELLERISDPSETADSIP